MSSIAPAFSRLPLIGRSTELAALTSQLDAAAKGTGHTTILAGEGGVGKTRLLESVLDRAMERGYTVAIGRAYPVETGVPYALFSDAFLPILRRMDGSALQMMTRGGTAELAYMFPALALEGRGTPARGDASELKSRLLWNFAQFIARLSAKKPMLLALENLQWADASSIELLHFLARQVATEHVAIVCTYNETERDLNPHLRNFEQSLVSIGAATSRRLGALSLADTGELVRRAFSAEHPLATEFTALLYGWTRGNPFFIEETLKSLVETGRLYQRDGAWQGWDIESLDLPRTVRDAVLARLGRLSASARGVADMAAVIGAAVTHDALAAVTNVDAEALLAAIDELRRERVLLENDVDGTISYDFTHPLVRDVLYTELGRARARVLHGVVAEALERRYGELAASHAGELAFHFARADGERLASKAIRYLTAAGRDALAKHANREAASYLAAALQQADKLRDTNVGELDAKGLVEDLARARQRLGEYDQARELWERALTDAEEAGRHERVAVIHRRLGLASYWSGRHDDALAHFDRAIEASTHAGDDRLAARVRLARGMTLQELGEPQQGLEEVEHALAIAQDADDPALLARAHRALLMLYLFQGPPERAREHGSRAAELAAAVGERGVEWSAQWALAILEGFTGNTAAMQMHLSQAERIADELRSPVLRVWTSEVAIEFATGRGDWDAALALGERSIALARALGQRTLLPRVLVWTALIHTNRGEWDRAKAYLDEAWTLSRADRIDGPLDVHTVVPAHLGMAAYHLLRREYKEAIEVGERGLSIADRTGYVAWAIHRLLPIIGEASLWVQDWERAQRHADRVRREASQLGHQLGVAWADASDAVIAFIRDWEPARAIPLMTESVERLEAIPFVEYAARIRRILARALAFAGDREAALRELRTVHETLVKLRAEPELTLTRDLMREMGGRPPSRTQAEGAEGLTGREVEIAKLVAARKSNKEIGQALEISPRTVSTHLSNIFQKLNVTSRGELTDLVRSEGLGTGD